MATDLYPYARVAVDFDPTDTWDPTIAYGAAGYDHRENDWVGALYPHVDASKGRQVLRGVKNTSGADIAANLTVMTDATSTNIDHVEVGGAGALNVRVRGVTIGEIKNGRCGFVVCQGPVTATDSGSAITVDGPIASAAAGDIADAGGGAGTSRTIIGSAFAAIGANNTGTVYIDVL